MSITPGAWEAKEDEYGFWGVYGPNGELLAEANKPEENEADIRLMAAARDLKAMLERCQGYIGALAKAHNDLPFLRKAQSDIGELLTRIEQGAFEEGTE